MARLVGEALRVAKAEARKRYEARRRGQDVPIQYRGRDLTLPHEYRQWPGEDDADYKRRYKRMVQARRRANPELKAREGEMRRALYAEKGPGEAKLAWKAANQDKLKVYSREHFERNRDLKIKNLKAWTKANPGRHRAASDAWMDARPGYKTAAAARIRAKIIERTPVWADWRAIWRVYGAAKQLTKTTGIPHEVDHIIPLNGKNVSGLHVHYNLQVLPAADNRKKRNYIMEAV